MKSKKRVSASANALAGRHPSKDVFTRAERSRIMGRIRSTRTKPEIIFKRFLELVGARFQFQPRLFGRPDFLVGGKVAVFIDNAFWHGKGNIPRSNRVYWIKKLRRNRQRDLEVSRVLRSRGYVVLRLDDKLVLKLLRDLG